MDVDPALPRTRALLLLLAAIVAICLPGAARAASSAVERAAQTRIVVRFAAGVSKARRHQILAHAGVRAVGSLPELDSVVGTVAPGERDAAVAALGGRSGVVSAVPDATVQAAFIPADPIFGLWSWPAVNTGLESAWNVTLGSPQVTIAIVDTGVTTVPDLSGSLVAGVDLVDSSASVDDPNGHGTEVASIAAARTDNAIGIAGVCGRCSIMPVRVLDAKGSGLTSTVASGVIWAADHGARVINLSLAGSTNDPTLDSAISYATSQGATVVVAAGNAGSSDASKGGYPAASAPSAVRVAGITQAGALFPWSNFGPWVDIAAPGSAAAIRPDGTISLGVQGTSVASPFVAGVAGLLLSYAPQLSPAGVKQALVSGGRPTSLDTGTGRVLDAFGALEAVGYKATAAPAPAPAPPATAQPSRQTQSRPQTPN